AQERHWIGGRGVKLRQLPVSLPRQHIPRCHVFGHCARLAVLTESLSLSDALARRRQLKVGLDLVGEVGVVRHCCAHQPDLDPRYSAAASTEPSSPRSVAITSWTYSRVPIRAG